LPASERGCPKRFGPQFEDEIAHSLGRLRDSTAPYTRFVRAEGDKLTDMNARLTALESDLGRLRVRVDAPAAQAAS